MHGHMSKRRTTSLVLALVLTAAACTGNKVNNSTDSAQSGETTTSVATKSDPNAKVGGELKIGLEIRPETLDVMTANAVNTSSWAYISTSIYDGLTGRSPVDGKVENRLAEKIEPSADFRTWRVTLRTGIKFTDGSPLTAQVVVDNYKFRADPSNACPCIGNFKVMHPAVVNDNTLTITLDEPDAHLPDPKLLVPILAESLLTKGADRDKHPIGTGPFKLTNRDQLVVERNPDYWRKDDQGRKLPLLDKITFVPVSDGNVRLADLDKGDIDMLEAYDGPTISAAKKDSAVKTNVSPGAGTIVAILNTATAPFDDIRMRMAVAQATDRDALAQSFPDGSQTSAQSFIDKNSPFKITGKFPDFDLAAAKKLTTAYGNEKGAHALDLDVVCVTIPEAQAAMPIVMNQLRDAGFNPKLRMLDIGEYAATVLTKATRNFDLACTRASSFASDPAGIATFVRSDGAVNVSGYNNPAMDKLFDQDKVTTDPAERLKIFQQVNDLVIKDLPYIPLLSNVAAIVTSDKVHGLSAIDADWAAHVDTAWLWKS